MTSSHSAEIGSTNRATASNVASLESAPFYNFPKQLRNCRFITICQPRVYPIMPDGKLRFDGKKPIQMEWESTNNYSFDDSKFQLMMRMGFNYGVLGWHDNLIIIDFDDLDLQNKVLPLLPKTFSVRSGGKGLLHLYFRTDDTHASKVMLNA